MQYALDDGCVVPKLLTLKTFLSIVANGNKGVKLTERKIKGIVRDKINNNSTKWVAWVWKVSESTVKRIWIHWTKYHELLPIKKAGRKKTVLDEYQVNLILEVSLINISGSFDVVKASTESKIWAQDASRR